MFFVDNDQVIDRQHVLGFCRSMPLPVTVSKIVILFGQAFANHYYHPLLLAMNGNEMYPRFIPSSLQL